jgi:hypothetical protein
MENLTPTQRKIAAHMLRLAAESYSNHGCNDFELPNTPNNLQFVKDMIAQSDYMEDAPSIHNGNLLMLDWEVMEYCADLLDPQENA